jgi:hypothetical protein
VERAVVERGDQGADSAKQRQWLAWARRYADELDPLKGGTGHQSTMPRSGVDGPGS